MTCMHHMKSSQYMMYILHTCANFQFEISYVYIRMYVLLPGWHILTCVGCAAPGASSPDIAADEVGNQFSSPTSVVKNDDTPGKGPETANEAAATSVASH
jgi:hypothetical protein